MKNLMRKIDENRNFIKNLRKTKEKLKEKLYENLITKISNLTNKNCGAKWKFY